MDVYIQYTNHRGETAVRHVVPHEIRYGRTTWHPDEQWLMDAMDLDKEAMRTFAMKDIHQWVEGTKE